MKLKTWQLIPMSRLRPARVLLAAHGRSNRKSAVKKLTPKFFGEKIVIGREYSQKVGLIYLKFRLPTDAHLLETAQSYVRVFTDDGNVIAQGYAIAAVSERFATMETTSITTSRPSNPTTRSTG